jgi:hypothetical protein
VKPNLSEIKIRMRNEELLTDEIISRVLLQIKFANAIEITISLPYTGNRSNRKQQTLTTDTVLQNLIGTRNFFNVYDDDGLR